MLYFDFPLKEKSESLREEGKLKINSKVEISSNLIVDWKNHAHIQNIVFAIIISLIVVITWGIQTQIITYITILIVLDVWLHKDRIEYLGKLNSNDSLREFLDKFAENWQKKFWKYLIKIITFGKVEGKEWRTEYGLLVLVYRLSKDNPEALSEMVRKCRNKKEFRRVTAII